MTDLPTCEHGFVLPPSSQHMSQCAACIWSLLQVARQERDAAQAEVTRLREELAEVAHLRGLVGVPADY